MMYFNKMSYARIAFQFDEYGQCTNENLQASFLFFKFLCMKPDLEIEWSKLKNAKPIPRLKLFVPDTIIYNDVDSSTWTFTDNDGYVKRKIFLDHDVIDKFKSTTGDNNEIIAIYKAPVLKNGRITENQIELLNYEGLEKYLLAKTSSQVCIQRIVKSKGPKAFICRSVWRRHKPAYVYVLTNTVYYFFN